MRNILRAILLPFYLAYQVISALVANPFRLSFSHRTGLELGLVPVLVILVYILITLI